MATCCDTQIIPDGPCSNNCSQLINACCVINEDNLPCLFPTVLAEGTLTAYTYNITSLTFTAPDTISDVVAGMTAFIDQGGSLTALGVVVSAGGTTATLDTPLTTTLIGANIVFKKVEIRQCDVNEAISDAICALQGGTVPCRQYTDVVTLNTATYNWDESSTYEGLLVSSPLNCEIRLRGIIQATDIPGTQTFQITTTLFTLPVTARPAVVKLIPTVVQVSDPLAAEKTALFVPAMYTIQTTGEVILTIVYPNPCFACDGEPYFDITHDLTFTVTFDSVTYNL